MKGFFPFFCFFHICPIHPGLAPIHYDMPYSSRTSSKSLSPPFFCFFRICTTCPYPSRTSSKESARLLGSSSASYAQRYRQEFNCLPRWFFVWASETPPPLHRWASSQTLSRRYYIEPRWGPELRLPTRTYITYIRPPQYLFLIIIIQSHAIQQTATGTNSILPSILRSTLLYSTLLFWSYSAPYPRVSASTR